MLPKLSGVETERTASKFRKKNKIFVLCSHTPRSRRVKLGSFMSQSCKAAKKCTKTRAASEKFVALAPYFCDPKILLPW